MSKITPENESHVRFFESFGLTTAKALEAAKSPKPANILKELIEQNNLGVKDFGQETGVLLVTLAIELSKSPSCTNTEREYVLKRIVNGDLKTVDQVNGMSHSIWFFWPDPQHENFWSLRCLAAVKFVDINRSPVNDKEFDGACGVGKLHGHDLQEVVDKIFLF